MTEFAIIIFSGNRNNVSYDKNRIGILNAQFIAQSIGSGTFGGFNMACEGVWEGGREPSHMVALSDPTGVPELAAGIGRMFKQDAVIYGIVQHASKNGLYGAMVMESLPHAKFTLEYSNGYKIESESVRVLPYAECKAQGIEDYTVLGETGMCLVIDFGQ